MISTTLLGCEGSSKDITLGELITERGHPTLVASEFEITDKGDDFTVLTVFGVDVQPSVGSPEDELAKDHWLVFSDDYHFLRQVEVHFASKGEPHDLGSTLFLSRSSAGTKFQIARVTPHGLVPEVIECKANVAKLVRAAKQTGQ